MIIDYEKLETWLTEHGYDGLYCMTPTIDPDTGCACSKDDLAPCGEISGSCRPGVKSRCDDCVTGCDCRAPYGWCIRPREPATIDGFDLTEFVVGESLAIDVVVAISESIYNGQIKIVKYTDQRIGDAIYDKFLESVEWIESSDYQTEQRPGLYEAKLKIDGDAFDLEIGSPLFLL